MKIIFDATRLKYPNTGLYHFTLQLARALEDACPQSGCTLEYLVYDTAPELGTTTPQRRVRPWHKFLNIQVPGATLTHTPYQHYRYKKARRTKQILTIHDLNFLVEKSPKKQKKYLRLLQSQIDRADKIVAISHYAKSDIERHCQLQGREITVIHNGSNINPNAATPPQEPPKGDFIFGIGTILPKKNWHTLPCLLVGNSLELIIAGQGSGYNEEIMQQAREYGVEDRVRLVGTVSEGEKKWYLEKCRAFVFPSLAEGFGLPVLEALATGCRVFSSPHCSLPEVADNCAHYFPRDFDPAQMQQLFNSVMATPPTAQEQEAARSQAKKFSWHTAAEKYIELYKTLIIK